MEIDQIRYFCTLAETSHMRQAAALLGLSVGALSKSMQVLQADLGLKLFVPNGRGIEITSQGRRFYSLAQGVLSEFERLENGVTEVRTEKPPLRIASLELFTGYFMSQVIKRDFPEFGIDVIERLPGAIETSIIQGEADLGITFAPVPNRDLDFLKICSFEKRIFVRKGAFKGFALSDIPFAAPKIKISGSPSGISDLDGWPADFPRKVKYHFDLLETSLQVARNGLCAVFCPAFVVPLQNEVVKPEFHLEPWPLPSQWTPVKRQVYIVKRKDENESKDIKRLAKSLRMLCAT